MNIKAILMCIIACIIVGIQAAPHGPAPRPLHHPPAHRIGPYRPVHAHHLHHHPGHPELFWAGFAGSLIGHTVVEAIRPSSTVVVAAPAPQAPVIIQSPAVSPKMVWVEGHYENQVLANGSVVKIWIPGAWVHVP